MADIIKTQYMDKAIKGYSEYIAKTKEALDKTVPKEGDRAILLDGSLYVCLSNGKWDLLSAGQGSTGGGGSITIDQHYSPESQNAQSGIAVAEALETIVRDLEQISSVNTVDKWEYNKFYKNINPEWFFDYDYVFDDGTSKSMGALLPISIVVKYKETVMDSTHGEYEKDIVYNFDGQKVRKWIIDPVKKTIVLNEFIPIDKSKAITEINETATNTQYPTALAVKNYVDTVIGGIENGSY